MMLPACPIAHLIISQPGFALASLEAFFDAMFGFGHPREFPKRRLRWSVGERIIHLHHLFLVSVTVAYHHHHLLVARLTPMGSGHHTSLDHLNHQRTFTPVAHIDPAPGLITKRLAPGRDALPGPRGPTTPATIRRRLDLQITHRRVRRHRQHLPLTQGRTPTAKPVRAPHLVVTGHPSMWQT